MVAYVALFQSRLLPACLYTNAVLLLLLVLLLQDLKHTMAGLLRLHMSLSNEALGDEQVLAVYPTTIRRCAANNCC
jgi:hypothetical protein